jgi:RNA polymerase sigma-70 factor, ECF subfamily
VISDVVRISEAALLKRSKGETMSEVDWDRLYWELSPRLYNFFRYRTGDSEVAKDLCSRTLMKAWRYRESYKSKLGDFEAWLFQIARNIAIDYLREESKAALPLNEEVMADFSLEAEVQKKLDARRLYDLLNQLPQREQEIIALKFGAEMNNREIAVVLEMGESNVGTVLHRSILKLRQQWEFNYVRE